LQKEKDPASRERLQKLEKELANLKAEEATLRAQWEEEKQSVHKLGELREQIEQTRLALEQAQRAGDLARASELKYGKLPELEGQLKVLEMAQAGKLEGPGRTKPRLIKEEVTEEDIAEVVSRWTGIPVSKLLEGEIQKLLHLEDELHRR